VRESESERARARARGGIAGGGGRSESESRGASHNGPAAIKGPGITPGARGTAAQQTVRFFEGGLVVVSGKGLGSSGFFAQAIGSMQSFCCNLQLLRR
jgi:hypothetical protein